MFFNKKYTKIKLKCYNKESKYQYDDFQEKNVFINIFYFVIIEPEDITNKSWIEYTDNFNDYEIDGIYDGLMNNKTGEVTLQ